VREAGETQSGITIHYVNERYDEGDILFQATCPVAPDDDAETIARRVLELEHEHYPRIVEKLLKSV
ncbi:MAG: phosphoribosylglycinamide formyltransferase, partial [Saprospiraceae bacterium]|nr:phosphoribosylglycinamide formyltransferase [Saprospiraceae bacterium]